MGTKEEAATETAPPETEAEAPVEVEERRVLTVSEFLAVLPQLLTPTALNASLCINGSPVHDIGTICIRCSPDNKPVVDVMTDGGSNG